MIPNHSYKYDFLTFIGRFQPYHLGHDVIVRKALTLSQNVIIVIGGTNRPRTIRNPWTADERVEMISRSFSREEQYRLIFIKQKDYAYNDQKWLTTLQQAVYHEAYSRWKAGPYRLGLIGFAKDNTSFYLKMFPTWGNEDVEQQHIYAATDIRKNLFSGSGNWDSQVPRSVENWIRKWMGRDSAWKRLCSEWNFIETYKEQWNNTPYPVTFNTVDAVVIQGGHILLIRRRSEPGKGLWALPGGFIQTDEFLLQAMLRELREETKIAVPENVLRGSIVKSQTFDNPFRSMRGRTITHAFYINLGQNKELDLPKVKGSDDAEKAVWVPLSEIKSETLFEDHYDIITAMIGI
jgi:bifunctional NMN adenylyltransferase/nudix hydrolase